MSKIQISTNLSHQNSRSKLTSGFAEEALAPYFFLTSDVPVGATLQELPTDARVTSPSNIFIKNTDASSGDILLSLDDGTTFPFRLKPGAGVPLRMNNDAYRQVSTVTVDVAGSLAGTYFDFRDRNGPVRPWFDFNAAVAPDPPGDGRLVPITIASDDSAETVAAAIVSAFADDLEILASAMGAVVTLSDKNTGVRAPNIADGASATGFAFATVNEGATAPVVKIKSTSTSFLLYGAAQF